jgi:hypothetical protein
MQLNLERKKKRMALKKKQRHLHNVKRMPSMYMICDVSSCAWLLRQLNPNRTLLVIDEAPMGADLVPEKPEENPLCAAMVQSMMTPMYKTVLMSATLPRTDALPSIVTNFLDRFNISLDKKDQHVKEAFSCQLDRGVMLIRPSGAAAFPHELCKTAAELKALSLRLPADPLVLKAYTERALSSILSRWQALDQKKLLPASFKVDPPQTRFAVVSDINHTSIRDYAIEILQAAAATGDDAFVANFCSHEKADEFGDAQEEKLFPQFNLQEMMFTNAHYFPGLTLVADDGPAQRMDEMAARLLEKMPSIASLEEDLHKQEAQQKKQDKFKDDDEEQYADASMAKLKFSPQLVIQSEEFLKKWCPDRKGPSAIPRMLPTVKEFEVIKDLPMDDKWKMLALAGAGSFDPTLDEDPNNPVYTQWVHESMTEKKLAVVTAGKEFTWGANVPASTVVLTQRFANSTSVSGMLQYVGRCARRGLTTHGQALFERDEDVNRLFLNSKELGTEADTIERYAKWWLCKGESFPPSTL